MFGLLMFISFTVQNIAPVEKPGFNQEGLLPFDVQFSEDEVYFHLHIIAGEQQSPHMASLACIASLRGARRPTNHSTQC